MTEAERRLVEAAVTWWHANRFMSPPIMPGAPLWNYYQQGEVRTLVEAAAETLRQLGVVKPGRRHRLP